MERETRPPLQLSLQDPRLVLIDCAQFDHPDDGPATADKLKITLLMKGQTLWHRFEWITDKSAKSVG